MNYYGLKYNEILNIIFYFGFSKQVENMNLTNLKLQAEIEQNRAEKQSYR